MIPSRLLSKSLSMENFNILDIILDHLKRNEFGIQKQQ